MGNRGEVFDYAANNCGIEIDGFSAPKRYL